MNRPGLLKILDLAIKGEITELVIVHRDRLARFGYDLIEHLLEKYSTCEITVLSSDEKKEPREELVEDILSIMNVFTAKVNGMRKSTRKN
jgi:putative resolvase